MEKKAFEGKRTYRQDQAEDEMNASGQLNTNISFNEMILAFDTFPDL